MGANENSIKIIGGATENYAQGYFVYDSNTGGQMSKSTPLGAIARFAEAGKPVSKKDLGWMAMSYTNVYVARVAMGYNFNQAVKAFNEADAYKGPSLIIAYSHCIMQGIDMSRGMEEQRKAVESGAWVLYRHNPEDAIRYELYKHLAGT